MASSVPGQALQWLRSFLADRSQAVVFAGSTSVLQNLCGIPQGSILGPMQIKYTVFRRQVLQDSASMLSHSYSHRIIVCGLSSGTDSKDLE